MSDNIPPGDSITGGVGDNAHHVAIGKKISQSNTTVTSSGDRSLAIGGNVTGSMIVTGDNNQVYMSSRKPDPPLHYPPRSEHFVGRKDELEQLLADLYPGHVITLCGPGGIGKTALAAEAIARLATDPAKPPERFPDGVFFHSFYNQKETTLVLEQIALSFGEPPRPTPIQAAQRALANKRALLVLDGAEDADDLHTLLAVRGNCGVLVTSRRHNDAGADFQDIRPLPKDEAVELLQSWGGKYANDQATAHIICSLVGALPLALRLVGRFLSQMAINCTEYLIWLQTTPLAALDHGKRREESVPLLLERSWLQISELARNIWSAIGVLAPVPFERQLLKVALNLDEITVIIGLGELVNFGLLQRQQSNFIVSHTLIHTFAFHRLKSSTHVVNRFTAYFENFSWQQNQLGLHGYSRLNALRLHIMAVLNICAKQKKFKEVIRLVHAIDDYLDLQGLWHERLQTLENGINAARQLNDLDEQGALLGNLGNVFSYLGDMDKATQNHKKALVISRKIGNRYNESTNLANLGYVHEKMGSMEDAMKYYECALAIAQEIRYKQQEGVCLGGLGNIYSYLHQWEKAKECYQKALKISQELKDRRNEGYWLGDLGNIHRSLKQYEKAIEHHNAALRISREIGDRHSEGLDLSNLGAVYLDTSQVEQAIDYYHQALTIAKEIADRHSEGRHLLSLAIAYRQLGQLDTALINVEQGLRIARDIQDPLTEGYHLCELGNIYYTQKKVVQARYHFQQALALFMQVKSPHEMEVRGQLEELEKQE